jgi:RNA recognition motif-containing protein
MYSSIDQAGLPSSFFTAKAPISTGSQILPLTFHQTADYVQSTMTPLYEYNSSSLRTVYLGNLPHDVTPKDICDMISVGVIESIKLVNDKNCAFITFLDGEIAQFFLKQVVHRPLDIGGRDIKVGWGKKSLLSETLWQAVKIGASRNVVLANVLNMTHEWLESIFSVFGIIESITIYPEQDTASIHLTTITAAIKAVVTLSMDSRWGQTRISYGRDRCAPPAASTSLLTLPKSLNKSFHSSLLYNSEPLVDQCGNSTPLMGNRTVYLGGIHPEATTKDLCDVIFNLLNYLGHQRRNSPKY